LHCSFLILVADVIAFVLRLPSTLCLLPVTLRFIVVVNRQDKRVAEACATSLMDCNFLTVNQACAALFAAITAENAMSSAGLERISQPK
jgi:hypothetical protein